ncbi:MAG: hypothetical protein IPG18_18125 [Saprospiraceae bacterium]|nr:hypothetical protein [Saprospiraceae bacterium]
MNIYERADEFDITVIIRGGGSKLDLAGFDNYLIAHIPYLFLTFACNSGIGHEIRPYSNRYSFLFFLLKTPTAVAAWLRPQRRI